MHVHGSFWNKEKKGENRDENRSLENDSKNNFGLTSYMCVVRVVHTYMYVVRSTFYVVYIHSCAYMYPGMYTNCI